MIRIAALTPGKNVASSRFRVRQYIPALRTVDIYVDEYPSVINYSAKLPGILGKVRQRYIFPLSAAWLGIKAIYRVPDLLRSRNYDLVWVNRIMAKPVSIEGLISRPIIFDIDDAIWLNKATTIGKIASRAEIILAGNEFIALSLEKYNRNIRIIPTAVDTNRFKPVKERFDNNFNVVWTGSGDTIHYLSAIEKPLAQFFNNTKMSRLIIISDLRPALSLINPDKISFIQWSEENEVSGIQRADLGIMPLFNNEWEKGKCSFKMLQYMACGLPVIVSPVGMNKEVLVRGNIGFAAVTDNDWIESLNYIYNNREVAAGFGLNGREVVNTYYSLPVIVNKLTEIFNSL